MSGVRHASERQAFQILDQVVLFSLTESQAETTVVVIHDIQESCETAVVVKAAFSVCKNGADR